MCRSPRLLWQLWSLVHGPNWTYLCWEYVCSSVLRKGFECDLSILHGRVRMDWYKPVECTMKFGWWHKRLHKIGKLGLYLVEEITLRILVVISLLTDDWKLVKIACEDHPIGIGQVNDSVSWKVEIKILAKIQLWIRFSPDQLNLAAVATATTRPVADLIWVSSTVHISSSPDFSLNERPQHLF